MANHLHRWPLAINVKSPENVGSAHTWPNPQDGHLWRLDAPLTVTLGSLAIYGESPGKLGVFHRWPLAINGHRLAIYGRRLAIYGGGHV